MRIKTKEFEITEIGVEEGVDLGSEIKDSLLPHVVLGGGDSFNANDVEYMDNINSIFYIGHLPMKTEFNANIDCLMSLKWSHGQIVFHHKIQVGQQLTTTCHFPCWAQKSSASQLNA